MPWQELHILTDAKNVEYLTEKLSAYNPVAITLQDGANNPIFEPTPETPKIWAKTIVIALFDGREDLSVLKTDLKNDNIKIKHIPDEDWVKRSLDSFTPLKFGKKLWICPSWHTPPSPHDIIVHLDPGLAFGTGTHPTTALCLRWLEENIQSEQSVMDYGCGSGILGIAALKLGAKCVIAVDSDHQALISAEFNAKQNACYPPVFTTYLPENVPHKPVDLVIANILAQPLISLAPTLASLTAVGGKIVLSGILFDQFAEIIEIYKNWYSMETPVFDGEWVRLVGIRANNI